MKRETRNRVIYFLPGKSRFPSGRAESFTSIYTAEALAKQNCALHVFFSSRGRVMDPTTAEYQGERAMRFYGLNKNSYPNLYIHKVPSADFLLPPYRNTERRSFSLFLYLFLHYLSLVFVVLLKIFQHGRPNVIYTRNLIVACLFVLLRPLLNIPVVYEVHWVGHPYLSRKERFVFRFADVLVALTRSIEAFLVKEGVPPGKICYATTGVRLEDFSICSAISKKDIRRKLHLPVSGFLITYVGSFYKDKGVDLLLETLRLLKRGMSLRQQVKLVLIGGFQWEEDFHRIQELARAQELEESVIFTGYVLPHEVPNYLHATDLAVYTPKLTTYHELCGSGGLKVWQYMAARKPILLSKFRSTEEIIDHGVDGWLVEPTPNSIAQAIRHLILDPRLRDRIALNAFRKVSENFTWDKRAERLCAFFKEKGFI